MSKREALRLSMEYDKLDQIFRTLIKAKASKPLRNPKKDIDEITKLAIMAALCKTLCDLSFILSTEEGARKLLSLLRSKLEESR